MALYVMLVGAYPFEDPTDPRNFRKTIQVRREDGVLASCAAVPWWLAGRLSLGTCVARRTVGVPSQAVVSRQHAAAFLSRTHIYTSSLPPLPSPPRPAPALQRIMSVKYSFPANLHLSRECLDLISRIFVANPAQARRCCCHCCMLAGTRATVLTLRACRL